MNESEGKPDHVRSVVAVLIAVVSVVGAIFSWRIASTLGAAGGADTSGILASVDREDVTTSAALTLMEHRSSFSSYVENDALYDAYANLANANPGNSDLASYSEVFHNASLQALSAIPSTYVDREGNLDELRDIGEHIAQASRNKDVEPQAHFSNAARNRDKAMWLFVSILLLAVVLVLLTLADAIDHWLRLVFLAGGIVGLVGAVLIGLVVEFVSASHLFG